MKDKARQHPSYIKDTNDFVNKIKNLKIPIDALLISLDVESMYTNIDLKNGLDAVSSAFENHEKTEIFYSVLKLLELSLKNNDFEFNDNFFLQIRGTSMGKKFAPHYADIFMAKFERDALEKCPLKPLIYLRYLDDIFIVWTHGEKAFAEFLTIFNSHQPPIKFKAEIHNNSIDFLDTTIFKCPEKFDTLLTKVYFKPTDSHQLLFKTSFHPKHTFKGVLKSQIIRFYRICSREADFEDAWGILYEALSKRKYSKRWLRKIKSQTILELQTKERTDYVQECNPSSSRMGAGPCNTIRCMTCQIVPNCQNFTSSTTGETFGINSQMDCASRNIIYLYTCKFCNIQYVGETGNALRDRANRHRASIYSENALTPLYAHLVKCHKREVKNWNDENFILVPIEQVQEMATKTLTKMERLKRETYWIDTLNTFDKYGLNSRKLESREKPKSNVIPFIVPFSKTGNLAAQIIKKHLNILKAKDQNREFDFEIITAFSRHKNIRDHLVKSKLKA